MKLRSAHIITILLFCPVLLFSQRDSSDLEKSYLKGKVKSVIEVEYADNDTSKMKIQKVSHYNTNGNITEVKEYSEYGFIYREKMSYDAKGEILSSMSYGPDSNSILGSHTFKHDKNGHVTERARYDKGGIVQIYRVRYDDKDQMTEEGLYLPDGSAEYYYRYTYRSDRKPNDMTVYRGKDIDWKRVLFYDSKGYDTAAVVYGPDDSIISTLITRYDEKDHISQTLTYNMRHVLTFDNHFKYNEEGRVLEHISDQHFGIDRRETEKNSYDTDGKLISVDVTTDNENGKSSYKELYEYDKQGNCTRKYYIPMTKGYITRQISYYP